MPQFRSYGLAAWLAASFTAGCAPESGTGATDTGGASASGGSGNAAGTTASGGTSGATPCLSFAAPSVIGQVQSSALSELSGLAASRAQPGVLYAHADSGAPATFIAMDTTGKTLGNYTLSGMTATDWEDIAVAPAPGGSNAVYVGDIGDNAARTGTGTARSEIQVYRVTEPVVSLTQTVVNQTLTGTVRLRFTYPDRAHDAETLMVDPVTGDILIVTKETNGASGVFRAPGSTPADQPTVLETITTLTMGTAGAQSALVTAGDISPNGDRLILRTYTAIWLWPRAAGTSWGATFAQAPVELPSPTEPQGEGLTFSADGRAWLGAGEQESAIYQGLAACP